MSADDTARTALSDALLGSEPELRLRRLREQGRLRQWLPEVEALAALQPGGEHAHKDLWEHTLQVVVQSPCRKVVRWAALLHDIGKVPTRRFEPSGAVTFLGHAEQGALLFEEQIAPRLGFEAPDRERIAALVRHHQRVTQYDASFSDRAVRRLARTLGQGFEDLLALGRADVTSRFAERRERALQRIAALRTRWQALAEQDAVPPALPAGLGHPLMAHLGLTPGPRVGALLRRLEAAVQMGLLPRGAAPEVYLQWLDQHPDPEP